MSGRERTEDGKTHGRVAVSGNPSEQVLGLLGKGDERGPTPLAEGLGSGVWGLGAWGIRLRPLQLQATTAVLEFLQAPITALILVVRLVIG